MSFCAGGERFIRKVKGISFKPVAGHDAVRVSSAVLPLHVLFCVFVPPHGEHEDVSIHPDLQKAKTTTNRASSMRMIQRYNMNDWRIEPLTIWMHATLPVRTVSSLECTLMSVHDECARRKEPHIMQMIRYDMVTNNRIAKSQWPTAIVTPSDNEYCTWRHT
jgi:hypothetical protein